MPDSEQNDTGAVEESAAVSTPPAERPVVLVFGLRPERLLDTEGRIDAFLEPPEADQIGVLVEAVASGLQAGGHVIAIAPAWAGPAAERLQMARSMLDTHLVAVHETALPPLAATVLASLTSACAPYAASAGVLASLLPELEAELHVITWLGSVTGLSTPQPSFGQHVSSLAPGSAFAVSSYPEPAVHRLGSGRGAVPLPPIERPSRLVVAPHDGDVAWMRDVVHPALASSRCARSSRRRAARSGGAPASSSRPWSTRSTWNGSRNELTAALDPWVCRWCRELIARSPCPLCGHRGRPARRGGRPPAQPAAR